MATLTVNDVQLQIRNDTAQNWATENPVLKVGELGLETDTGNAKFGDGTTTWNSLKYAFRRNNTRNIEYIVGTQTASTAALTGATEDTSLYDGKCINYYLPYASKANATLELTFPSGSTSGAKPIYIVNTTRLGTQYGAGTIFQMTYSLTKDAWYCGDYYQTDTNNYDRRLHNNNIKAAAAVTAGTIIVGTSAGYKQVASAVTFDISYPILYASKAIAANGTSAVAYEALPGVNLATTKANWTGTQYAMAYLVGTLSGNTFTIDSSVLTTTVPSAPDGKVYIPIGLMADTTKVFFAPTKDIYAYYDGAFKPIVSPHNQASNTINAMTGYSKPSTTGDISASDTLNQAIGKLEKRLEPQIAVSIQNPGTDVWIEVPVEHLIIGSATPTDHNALWVELTN